MEQIAASELIINEDGTIFHLHLLPEQLADKVILVGDPDRVNSVAAYFDTIEVEVSNREFHTITGSYKGKRITTISHGIGTDNIDIVLNELDALANINLKKKTVNEQFKQLTLIRIGTSGGLQHNLKLGSYVISKKSIGLDTVLHYYENADQIRDKAFEEAFMEQIAWDKRWGTPYIVDADEELVHRFDDTENTNTGITISAVGFYGPQGRKLRLGLANPEINDRIQKFCHNDYCITNYEMESSALAGLARLMGHKAMTICSIIANRFTYDATPNYKNSILDLIKIVLEKI